MKPLKVLVYPTSIKAAKLNDLPGEPGTLISTNLTVSNGEYFDGGVVVYDNGAICSEGLAYMEVLPGQFDSEVVISVDVPGAINNALNPDSL